MQHTHHPAIYQSPAPGFPQAAYPPVANGFPASGYLMGINHPNKCYLLLLVYIYFYSGQPQTTSLDDTLACFPTFPKVSAQ